jgi:ABC-type Fe3+-hydroxamate transport system substrate-binding protein
VYGGLYDPASGKVNFAGMEHHASGLHEVIDQLGRKVLVPVHPGRIVSLVPSQTEWLFDLGLDAEVVGITRFCVRPDSWFRSKSRVGGTKDATVERIMALQPDLVIGNKEENTPELIEELSGQVAVWMSDVRRLEDALCMMRETAYLVGKGRQGDELIALIQSAFTELIRGDALRCAYAIWNDPLMLAGADTFISDIIMRMGWQNVAGKPGNRYPALSEDELRQLNPEVLLLSSEPFPFGEKHIRHYRELLPEARIILADGELFSWYGSRLLHTPGYLQKLIREIH